MTDLQRLMSILVLFGVLTGGGAAAGVTLGGTIDGNMSTAVDSAVVVPPDQFTAGSVSNDESVVSVSDDGTRFFVGTEVYQGEEYTIELPVENRGATEQVVELELNQTTGQSDLEIVVQSDESSHIESVVEADAGRHVFVLNANAVETLQITVTVPADSPVGFNRIEGTIGPVEGLA